MTDKYKMPVDGGGRNIGKPDGVSDAPDGGETHGRTGGGESSGGAYPNPHTGKKPSDSGFAYRGQTITDYHGGQNHNAPTGMADGDGERRAAPAPSASRKPHAVTAAGRTFSIVETSGVAAAEATGKVATDAPYGCDQEQPGSG